MSLNAPTDAPVNARHRSSKPERISIGDDDLVRQDVLAREIGLSERSMNRGDAHGSPFTFIGNVKYRPRKAFQAFLAARIQRKNVPRRRVGGGRVR